MLIDKTLRRLANAGFSRISIPWAATINIGGVKIKMQLKGSIEWKLRFPLFSGGWEYYDLNQWIKLCRALPNGAVVDVGANTGIYSLLSGVLNMNRRIYAFEPIPSIAAILAKNIQKNNLYNIEVGCIAVSMRNEFVELSAPNRKDIFYSFSLCRDYYPTETKQKYLVATIALDTMMAELGPVSLVKIDVEGYESSVLAGMSEILRVNRPIILFEVMSDTKPLTNDFLMRHFPGEYSFFLNGSLWTMEDISLIPTKSPYVNIYAVPSEKLGMFENL